MSDESNDLQLLAKKVAVSYNDLLNQIVETTNCTRKQAAVCIALVSRWLGEDS